METKERNRELTTPQTRTTGRSLWSLHDAIDRVFDTWAQGFGLEPFRPMSFEGITPALTVPPYDLSEDDKTVRITAELPGMDEKNIELTLEKDRVIIKGEKKEEKEEKKKNYYRKERSYGSIYREIPLPCEVISSKATADFKKGLLNITLPKTPNAQTQSRKIPIRGEG